MFIKLLGNIIQEYKPFFDVQVNSLYFLRSKSLYETYRKLLLNLKKKTFHISHPPL